MIDARRQAYLEAMGFDVWVARPPAPEPGCLTLGEGAGSTLLVCAQAEDHDTRLADDITRALGGDPVWAWPSEEGGPASYPLDAAVDQRLFTQLVVFGEELACALIGSRIPAVLGSAAVYVSASLNELAVRGTAKKDLWLKLQQGPDPAPGA